MGVALCLGGLALTIMSDINRHTPNADYPQALRGDILCMLGAALYAGSNVMQEDFVKNHNRVRVTLALSSIERATSFLWGIGKAVGCSNLAQSLEAEINVAVGVHNYYFVSLLLILYNYCCLLYSGRSLSYS